MQSKIQQTREQSQLKKTTKAMTLKLYKLLIVTAILLFGCISANGQSSREIDSLLHNAYEKDQRIRKDFMNMLKKVNSIGTSNVTAGLADSLVFLSEQTKLVDKDNSELLDRILKNGLPKNLSSQSYKTIWLIIDHSDLDQQKRYLPLMTEAATKGHISNKNLAVLTDRICMYEGKPQKYGTQSYTTTVEGKQMTYIWPVEEPEKINDLRKGIGECSIEEYVMILEQTSGCKVIFDPKLTVKIMKQKGLIDCYQ